MRDHSIPNGLCSMDPLTAMASVALGAIPGMMSSSGSGSTPAPAAPPPQAPPQQKPMAKASQQQPTFMGGIPTPPPSGGQKTLLGQ